MLPQALRLLCIAIVGAQAKSSATSNEFYTGSLSTLSSIQTSHFTGSQYTYVSNAGQSTVVTSSSNSNATSTSSNPQITVSTKTHKLTVIGGQSPTANGTSASSISSTSSAARPSNTVPCNGYPEFCQRQYSNITEVCAHNSAFVVPNNAGSNQVLGIVDQLNDGVRMLQGETHWVNNTVMNCHTTCELLDAGTWQSSLELLAGWLRDNPYDVVTWLIVNSDFIDVEHYVPAIQNSGLAEYLYTPDYVPQHRDQWPVLAEMILTGKRVVFFMDYNANQTKVPYILDEFTHIWETPFSPTNDSFPCTQQRPPHLKEEKARDEFMYLANHNLNTAVDLNAILNGGSSKDKSDQILIPNTAEINTTNGEFNHLGQAEAMTMNCTSEWDRPPNFLLVDFYNYGDPRQGSVFEVAARANGVTYNKKCCGLQQSSAPALRSSLVLLTTAVASALLLLW